MPIKKIIADNFWVTLRYGIVAVLGIIVSLAFARIAPKEVYGQYQFVLSVLALFSVLSLPGLNMAVLKAVSTGNYYGVVEAIRISFRWSLWAVPAIVGYGTYQFMSGHTLLGYAFIIGGCLFPLYYAPNTWYTYYEGQSQFRAVSIRVITSTLVSSGLLIVGLLFNLGVPSLIAIYLGTIAGFSLIYFWEITRKSGIQPGIESSISVPYALRVTGQKFVYTLTDSLPVLAVAFLFGTHLVATYQIASVFLTGISGLIGALAAISLPNIFKNSSQTVIASLWQSVGVGFIAAASYSVLVWLVFIPLYGEAYRDSFALALNLGGLPVIIALKTFFVNFYTAHDRNGSVIGWGIIANLAALAWFVFSRETVPFILAATLYLYLVHGLVLIPLAGGYWKLTRQSI